MVKITFNNTTEKVKDIKVRYRLRDGRGVQIYHKTDIVVDKANLVKLKPDGTPKDRIQIYDEELSRRLRYEYDIMSKAYEVMLAKGYGITAAIFEREIARIKNPVFFTGSLNSNVVSKFRKYADDSLRHGAIGDKKYKHNKGVIRFILTSLICIFCISIQGKAQVEEVVDEVDVELPDDQGKEAEIEAAYMFFSIPAIGEQVLYFTFNDVRVDLVSTWKHMIYRFKLEAGKSYQIRLCLPDLFNDYYYYDTLDLELEPGITVYYKFASVGNYPKKIDVNQFNNLSNKYGKNFKEYDVIAIQKQLEAEKLAKAGAKTTSSSDNELRYKGKYTIYYPNQMPYEIEICFYKDFIVVEGMRYDFCETNGILNAYKGPEIFNGRQYYIVNQSYDVSLISEIDTPMGPNRQTIMITRVKEPIIPDYIDMIPSNVPVTNMNTYGNNNSGGVNTDNNSSNSNFYESDYRLAESQAADLYNTLTNFSVQESNGTMTGYANHNYLGSSNYISIKSLYNQKQHEMESIRMKAAQHGVIIPQSPWETRTINVY